MTRHGLQASVVALGVAAFASFFPVQAVRADAAATPTAASPSLSEPAPTPGWAENGPAPAGDQTTAVRHPSRAYRHAAWRNEHRYVRSYQNPVASAANGVVGGVADLGSVAAYPFYCFPNYGSCSVRLPYRP